jgi:hypothetical protein
MKTKKRTRKITSHTNKKEPTWDEEENQEPITKEKSAPLGIIRPGRSRKEGMAMYVRETVDLRSMQETRTLKEQRSARKC